MSDDRFYLTENNFSLFTVSESVSSSSSLSGCFFGLLNPVTSARPAKRKGSDI